MTGGRDSRELVGCFILPRRVSKLREKVGFDRVIFGSDYLE